MAPERIEIFTAQVQEKTFPSWLRGKGYRLLVGEYLPGWGGPEPAGEEVCHACTVHTGGTVDSAGTTLWFLLPTGQKPNLSEMRLQEAAEYIFARLHRKAHTPITGLTSYVFPGQPPGTN
jgi:hypothetical protein